MATLAERLSVILESERSANDGYYSIVLRPEFAHEVLGALQRLEAAVAVAGCPDHFCERCGLLRPGYPQECPDCGRPMVDLGKAADAVDPQDAK